LLEERDDFLDGLPVRPWVSALCKSFVAFSRADLAVLLAPASFCADSSSETMPVQWLSRPVVEERPSWDGATVAPGAVVVAFKTAGAVSWVDEVAKMDVPPLVWSQLMTLWMTVTARFM